MLLSKAFRTHTALIRLKNSQGSQLPGAGLPACRMWGHLFIRLTPVLTLSSDLTRSLWHYTEASPSDSLDPALQGALHADPSHSVGSQF